MHTPTNRKCSTYQWQKEINRIRFTKNISYAEAEKQIKNDGGTYASAVQQRLITAKNTQNDEEAKKEKEELIRQLEEKDNLIRVLSRRIDEMERKKNKKENKKNRQQQAATTAQDEDGFEMEYDSGNEKEMDTGSQADTSPTEVLQRKDTGAIPKTGGAPLDQDQRNKVGGAIPNNIPNSFKRQLTSNDLILPSKKTTDQLSFHPSQTKPTQSQTKLIPALPKPNQTRNQPQQKNSQQQHSNRK